MIMAPAQRLEEALGDKRLDGYTLELRDFKKGRTERETYFNIFLGREGTLSLGPVIQGLFFIGRGDYIKAWVEFRYDPRVEFPDGKVMDLEENGLTGTLFSLLGDLIPPGGSMMVIYGAESHPLSANTEKGLKRSFPPAVTPLGYYLWKNDFRWFKDWYFPEGWMEGGMKLQATHPLDEDIRAEREAKTVRELDDFVERLRGRDLSPLEEDALARAEEILSSLTPTPDRG